MPGHPGTSPGPEPSGLGVDETYTVLMATALRHLTIASSQLHADRIVNAEDADHAVRSHRELVHALGAQAQVLLGPGERARAVPWLTQPDPVTRVAIRFTSALQVAVPTRPEQPELVSAASVARHYKNAAVAVRTATDHLITQASQEVPAPDAEWLLSPRGRLLAVTEVARMATQLAESRDRLHEQVSVRGRSIEIGVVPDLDDVSSSARDVRYVAADVLRDDVASNPTASSVARAGAQQMPLRTPDPREELRLRLTVLRNRAGTIAVADGPPVVSSQALADFAGVGVAVNTSAAVLGARIAGKDVRDPLLPDALKQRLAKAEAWRDVRDGLLRLSTTAPHDRNITHEAEGLLRLLSQMVPAARGTGIASRDLEPAFYAALGHATDVVDQIAHWNEPTLARLANAGDLYMPGRLLTRDDVSEAPELITAKLTDTPVVAFKSDVDAIRAGYQSAGTTVQVVQPSPHTALGARLPPAI